MTEVESSEKHNDWKDVELGNKLQLLRESRGYTIEDVSSQLYLDCSLIKGLESGDYSIIPSQAYVKGYIRNYIKLFDAMSEFKSFDLYENKMDLINIIPDSIADKKSYTFSRYQNNNLSYVVIASILLLILYYAEVEYSIFSKVATLFSSSKLPVEKNIIEKETVNHLNDNKKSITPEVTVKKTIKLLKDTDTLNMQFSHGSWAQVEDASGKKLISRFVRSGKVLNLRGKLPFTVVLGNSKAVTITVNGNNFNQSKYNEKVIAHFVINNKNLK